MHLYLRRGPGPLVSRPVVSESIVYAIQAGDRIKIGFTTDLPRRMHEMQTGSSVQLVCIGHCPGGQPLERALHKQFAGSRLHGEWFRLTGVERVELLKRLSGEPYFIKLPRAGRAQMLGRKPRNRYALAQHRKNMGNFK